MKGCEYSSRSLPFQGLYLAYFLWFIVNDEEKKLNNIDTRSLHLKRFTSNTVAVPTDEFVTAVLVLNLLQHSQVQPLMGFNY